MDVTLRLDGGELMRLRDADASHLYDALWALTEEVRGAVSAAGKLCHARRSSRQLAELLDEQESRAVRAALSRDQS
jgi:hypothetical protein